MPIDAPCMRRVARCAGLDLGEDQLQALAQELRTLAAWASALPPAGPRPTTLPWPFPEAVEGLVEPAGRPPDAPP